MYFLTKDDKLLEKYNTAQGKVSADIKKEFYSEPIYNKNFLKTEIRSHGNVVTDYYDKKVPKDSNYTCLAVISLNSALQKKEDYYL